MEGASVCLNTQTPLVQFISNGSSASASPRDGTTIDLSDLAEGVDYRYSPGGVTRMVLPLVRQLLNDRVLSDAHWVALNPTAPSRVHLDGMMLHNVALPPDRMAAYAKVKEAIWSTVHGLPNADPASEMFWTEGFSEYAYYNRLTTGRIHELDQKHDFDLFYIHDFQQLPVGEMLGTLKPKIFRWHIPFDASQIPDQWVERLSQYFAHYDVVIVSTRRYRDALKEFGHRGKVRQIYPFVDPGDYSRPGPEEVARVSEKLGIAPTDVIALLVGRMDPTKGQDRAIEAVAGLRRSYPELRLVLVGNGSFSSSGAGLGLSKSARWRQRLEETAKTLGLGREVVFTGHLPQNELDALYERCALTLLPSVNEGFGLVVVESWLHRKPPIVTERAGIAELIRPGKNGLLFDPDEPDSLGEGIDELLADETKRRAMGRSGARTAARCSVESASKVEGELVREIVGG